MRQERGERKECENKVMVINGVKIVFEDQVGHFLKVLDLVGISPVVY